jgi:ferredoxin, 2Fe-2S
VTVSRKTLHILPNNISIALSADENLLDTLNANKVSISQSCGGNGTCTTCRVFILHGKENCSPRTELEAERADERNFADNERLACQTEVFGDVDLEILNPEPVD